MPCASAIQVAEKSSESHAGPLRGTHLLGTISLTMWEEGGSYGAMAALGMIQIVPLVVIVAGLRSIELRIQRRAQSIGSTPSWTSERHSHPSPQHAPTRASEGVQPKRRRKVRLK